MPPIQDSYAQYADEGFAGDIADAQPATVISRMAETAAIAFGIAVTHGTGDSEVNAGGAGTFQGVSVRTNVLPAENADSYPVAYPFPVIQEGVIRVEVTEAVTPETVPAYSTADGTFGASGTANHTDVPRGRYESSAAANGIALLRLG